MDERLIFYTLVLLLGAGAQWIDWRLRLPSILLLLSKGFLAGQFYDQTDLVDQQTLFALVSLAVGIILLAGGLTLRFSYSYHDCIDLLPAGKCFRLQSCRRVMEIR